MFENWIVCDLENIKSSKLIKDGVAQDFYDGQNGSSLLKGIENLTFLSFYNIILLHLNNWK